MPLSMDVHEHIEGLTSAAVTQAHQADVQTQAKHGVQMLRYWFDEKAGRVFCLIDAPNEEARRPSIATRTDCSRTASPKSSKASDQTMCRGKERIMILPPG